MKVALKSLKQLVDYQHIAHALQAWALFFDNQQGH